MTLVKCQNCGNSNTAECNFCRFCGTRFLSQPQQAPAQDPFNYSAPRPYAWKTDEFTTQNEARRTASLPQERPATMPIQQNAAIQYRPQHLSQPYRCPVCSSQLLPRIERKISTAGWITFALLLAFVFPLFWIGLLIKEDRRICPSCNSRVG